MGNFILIINGSWILVWAIEDMVVALLFFNLEGFGEVISAMGF